MLDMQTIVSNETDPVPPPIVAIGSIHGGNAGNVILDEVRMQMSVRTYDDKTSIFAAQGFRQGGLRRPRP